MNSPLEKLIARLEELHDAISNPGGGLVIPDADSYRDLLHEFDTFTRNAMPKILEMLKTSTENEKWYAERMFSELSKDEWEKIHKALKECGVSAACDRMHGSWARHLFKITKDELNRLASEIVGEGESE